MRMVINEKTIAIDRSFELERLKEVVRSRAGKNCDALSGRLNILFEVAVNSNQIAVNACPLRRIRCEGFRSLRKFLAHKSIVIVLPMLVGLGIEIQTHHR